jgi:DNA-binding beta-propeller fold protein YncE
MTPMEMTITNNNELFVLEWSNKRVQVFRATTGEPLRHFIVPNILYVMDVSPDGNYMYINNRYNRGSIEVRDASDGSLLETVTLDVPIRRNIEDICVSPDGSFVFVSTREKIIQYATPGRTMGGRRYKKGMRRKHRKSRVRRLNKRGTKRKQRK